MPTDEMFGLRRNYLRTHISCEIEDRCDDGQLPTGWQVLTYWHFTAGRFNCRTGAALRSQQTRKGGKHSPASSVNPSGIVFAFARMWEIRRWII